MSNSRRLFAVVLCAFLLRLACILLTGTIDSEGTEYARLAQNLLAGNGYHGIATPGKNLMFPPLFPWMIAAVSLVFGNVELSGRLVSVVMGSLLVLPVFLIAQHLYGRSTGYIAAALAAIHPLLALFAATVYVESTYLTLLLSGIYCVLRACRSQKTSDFALAGMFFGLSYLTRQESVVWVALGIGLALVAALPANPRRLGIVLLRTLPMAGAFVLLAAPYVIWIHGETGQWRLETKSPLNYTVGSYMLNGMDIYEANYGVDKALSEYGVYIKSNIATIASAEFRAAQLTRYVVIKAKLTCKFFQGELTNGSALGSPLLFILAILGLFRSPWPREHLVGHSLLLATIVISAASTIFIFYVSVRFTLLSVPIMIIWAAHGVRALAHWADSTLRLHLPERAFPRSAETAFVVLITAAVPVVAMNSARGIHELRAFSYLSHPVRTAGEWLDRYAPGEKIVTDTSTVLAFHAQAAYVPYPYASPETVLRYLAKRGVRFLVLQESDLASRPYLASWMESGIPSTRAHQIYQTDSMVTGRIVIYELNQGD